MSRIYGSATGQELFEILEQMNGEERRAAHCEVRMFDAPDRIAATHCREEWQGEHGQWFILVCEHGIKRSSPCDECKKVELMKKIDELEATLELNGWQPSEVIEFSQELEEARRDLNKLMRT